ncbi:hypothetical protein EW146_g5777 [Bondarzewia mesenterica]|uniref:Solute carrier family 40 member n=1 Tax=Bondarzewia mesenterica TaxID=1095465 RepID=A0A4S4LR34_9AGAM|nr:hypothetical protein EW146_g5777 [Bondarzewia mesenterica]
MSSKLQTDIATGRDDGSSLREAAIGSENNELFELNEILQPSQVNALSSDDPAERSHLDTAGIWLLAAQHFSSAWGDRTAEFAFPLYLIELFVNTLLPASIYGFVVTGAGIVFSGTVGSLIDNHRRLSAIRTSILSQKLSASICYVIFLLLFLRLPHNDQASWSLFGAITLSGCALKLATVGMNVCVERDWVMTIACGKHEHLLRLNMIMRRIDLLCKLAAPLFVSLLTSTVGYTLSIVILLCIGVFSAVFEFLFVRIVFRRFPVLDRPRRAPSPEDQVPGEAAQGMTAQRGGFVPKTYAHFCQDWVIQQIRDWREFAGHPIFISSVSIALLYLTVLSFDSTFLSYLKSETNYSDPFIAARDETISCHAEQRSSGHICYALVGGTTRTCSSRILVNMVRYTSASTISYVKAISDAGLFRSEAISIFPAVLSFYIGINGRYRVVWNTVMLFGGGLRDAQSAYEIQAETFIKGMAVSRIGLWSFDLIQLTQLQQALEHHPRQNTLTALQYSLQNIFDLAHYGLTIGWNKPAQFKYAATVSLGTVFTAAVVYVFGYARQLRGHLFHFDKLVSQFKCS